MIKLTGINKIYRTNEIETVALENVNLEVNKGEFLSIMGPSGCGKSTLLNILGLLDNPTEGSYKLIDKEVAGLKEKERTQLRKGVIGFVFQSFNLIDELNVFENVELPLTYLGIKASERKERVLEILKRMNLSHRAKHFPQQLSGGQQQRVAIARAIALNPQYLFCDEPNSGLDPKTSLVIDELIHDITTEYNMTTIINTHDMNSVMGIGDSILYIYQGHKEWEGTKNDVFTATNERLNNFIFASDLLRKVKEEEIREMEKKK